MSRVEATPGESEGLGRRQAIAKLMVVSLGLGLPGRAAAQASSATVDVSQVQIAFVVGGSLGSGRLHYQGRTHPFSIGGLGIGGFGINRFEAVGTVSGLSRIEQFPGVYGAVRTGVAVGNTGRGQLLLENTNGVKMHLRARREGLALTIGGDGIVIQFK
jgi:hypothetical protein